MKIQTWTLAVLLAASVGAAQQPTPPDAAAAQRASDAAAQKAQADVVRDLTVKATNGEFDAEKASDAMRKAGMDSSAINEANVALSKAFDDARKKGKDPGKDQNGSGSGDWNFGQVYRDRDYSLTMSVNNNCRIGQTVTITYPDGVMMEGPKSVAVPPKSKIDVAMKLILTQPPMPMPPWPVGVNMDCYDLSDKLTLVHPELKQTSRTATGTYTYICAAMKRTYSLSMHVHQHGPPQPPQPPGGGGGDDSKKKNPACTTYWNHGEFYPSPTIHAPQQCAGEVRDQAREFFGPALESLRAKNPQAWAWAPSPGDIDKISPGDLIALKARADAQARSQR
jgi:hypothetical protein